VGVNLEKKYVTPKEASEIYGLSVGVLANWRYQRRGPKYYIVGGRKVLYHVSDFEAWIKRNPILTKDSLTEK
jgi:hypothetical protein